MSHDADAGDALAAQVPRRRPARPRRSRSTRTPGIASRPCGRSYARPTTVYNRIPALLHFPAGRPRRRAPAPGRRTNHERLRIAGPLPARAGRAPRLRLPRRPLRGGARSLPAREPRVRPRAARRHRRAHGRGGRHADGAAGRLPFHARARLHEPRERRGQRLARPRADARHLRADREQARALLHPPGDRPGAPLRPGVQVGDDDPAAHRRDDPAQGRAHRDGRAAGARAHDARRRRGRRAGRGRPHRSCRRSRAGPARSRSAPRRPWPASSRRSAPRAGR